MFTARLQAGGEVGRWLAERGVRKPHHLASLFSAARLDSGDVLMELADDLDIDDADHLQEVEKTLHELIECARDESRAESAESARRPSWVVNARAIVARRQEQREAEAARLSEGGWKGKLKVRPAPPLKARYGTRARRLAASGRPQARAEAEASERRRWVDEVVLELRSLNAPGWKRLSSSADPARLMRLQIGGRRAGTLRMRMREWKRYRVWLRNARRIDFPENVLDVIDYVVDRSEEPCTKSALLGFRAALRFIESVGGYGDGFTDDPLFANCFAGLVAAAAGRRDGAGTRQALPPTMAMMAMMEVLVTDANDDSYDAMLAWWGLVSCWAVLRFDDNRGLSPSDIEERDSHWELLFRRTKTTGDDKAVTTRVGVVDKNAWLIKADWMSRGWERWTTLAPTARDFFLCPPGPDGLCLHREMTYTEYSARLRGMLAGLMDPSTTWTLGEAASAVFSPHSFRAVLTSALSALGAGKEQLGWLMAWQTQGSATYIRTGRAMTLRMQSRLSSIVRAQWGKEDPIGEGDVLQQLREAMEARGMDAPAIQIAMTGIATFTPHKGTPFNLHMGPTIADPSPVPRSGPTVVGGSAGSTEAAQETCGPDERPPSRGFVISLSRKRGLRCLHLLGNCYRRPGVHYHNYEDCGTEEPAAHRYDQICGSCWPTGDESAVDVEEDELSESSSTATEGE